MAAVGIVTAVISVSQSLAFDFWRNPNTRVPNVNQVNPTITAPALTVSNLAADVDFCAASKTYYEKMKEKYTKAFADCASMLLTWGELQSVDGKCVYPAGQPTSTNDELSLKKQSCFWALGVSKDTPGYMMGGGLAKLLSETAPDPSKSVPDASGDISNYYGKSYFPMSLPLAVGAGLTQLNNKLITAKHTMCEVCKDSLPAPSDICSRQ